MTMMRQLAVLVLRLSGVGVFLLVLLFPAYKGMALGYVPVFAGLLGASLLMRHGGRAQAVFARVPERWFLAMVTLLPALVQVALLLALRPEPVSDGRFVFEEASTLAATGAMSPLTYYPPLQAWWYAAWFKLFGASALVAQVSQVPLSALVTFLTYALARRVAPAAARTATVLVACYPSFLAYVLVTPYYHYLYTAAVLATAWGWMASLDTAPRRGALAAGVASGLGALAKATQLIAPAQALMFWLLAPGGGFSVQCSGVRGEKPQRIGFKIGIFLLGMVLVVGPWAWRNARVFGDFVPVCTSGGLVFYSANNPDSNGLYSEVPDVADIRTPAEMLAHSRACSAKAKAFIREQPAAFARLAWRKLLHTWGGEATFAELINRRGQPLGRAEDGFSFLFMAGWALVAGLWSASSIRALRERRAPSAYEILCAAVVLSNLAVFAVFEGGDRHRLPLVPLVLVLALALLAPASTPLRATPS